MSIFYLNGDFIEDSLPAISHHDCGFTTGIGIFDSLLIKDKILIHGKDHFDLSLIHI